VTNLIYDYAKKAIFLGTITMLRGEILIGQNYENSAHKIYK